MSLSRKSAATATLALALLTVPGGTAHAQDPSCAYGQTCPVTISDSTPAAGQRVTISTSEGEFDPGSAVEFTVFGRSRTITANAAGAASASFNVPRGADAGTYQAVFSGIVNGQPTSVTVEFDVVSAITRVGTGTGGDRDRDRGDRGGRGGRAAADSTDDGSELPFTGSSELVPLGAAGLGVLGAGVLTVLAARRRRASADT